MFNKKNIAVVLIGFCMSTVSYAGSVIDVYRDGGFTVLECSVGKKIKIYNEKDGKCSWKGAFGTYSCSFVMSEAKKLCKNR